MTMTMTMGIISLLDVNLHQNMVMLKKVSIFLRKKIREIAAMIVIILSINMANLLEIVNWNGLEVSLERKKKNREIITPVWKIFEGCMITLAGICLTTSLELIVERLKWFGLSRLQIKGKIKNK